MEIKILLRMSRTTNNAKEIEAFHVRDLNLLFGNKDPDMDR